MHPVYIQFTQFDEHILQVESIESKKKPCTQVIQFGGADWKLKKLYELGPIRSNKVPLKYCLKEV